jgi:hypothetical protein
MTKAVSLSRLTGLAHPADNCMTQAMLSNTNIIGVPHPNARRTSGLPFSSGYRICAISDAPAPGQ